MRRNLFWSILAVALLYCGWTVIRSQKAAAAPMAPQAVSGGEMPATMVGHEYRQDDLPAMAAAPDGSLWVAWLSFVGDRDDIAIRSYRDGKWSNLQWVPNT